MTANFTPLIGGKEGQKDQQHWREPTGDDHIPGNSPDESRNKAGGKRDDNSSEDKIPGDERQWCRSQSSHVIGAVVQAAG